jgi:hypothetical protein
MKTSTSWAITAPDRRGPTGAPRCGHFTADQAAMTLMRTALWLKLDPSRDIFEEKTETVLSSAAFESAV